MRLPSHRVTFFAGCYVSGYWAGTLLKDMWQMAPKWQIAGHTILFLLGGLTISMSMSTAAWSRRIDEINRRMGRR